MVLREAFRYQNFLSLLLSNAESVLCYKNNYMRVVQKHLLSKAVSGVEDEQKDNISSRNLNVEPDTIIKFMMAVYDEKVALSKAINNAKRMHCDEMDMALSLNKTRSKIVERLKVMLKTKGTEVETEGTAFTLNNEGNQVPFKYKIIETSTADFDRFATKKIVQQLAAECEKTSTVHDYWLTSIPVEFTPAFDINDSFEELVDNFTTVTAS